MLLEDVDVVAVGMQRRKPPFRSLPAVVTVVVVRRHVRDLFLSEDPQQAPRQRRLASRRVADNAKQDRTGHAVDGIARCSSASTAASEQASSRATAATPSAAAITRG